jgi:hypothetical protein
MSEKDPYGNKRQNENSEDHSMSNTNMRETQGTRDSMKGDSRGVSSTGRQTQDMNDRTTNMQDSKKSNTGTMEEDEQKDE